MKKALQTPLFAGLRSLPERAVGPAAREARRHRSRDELAELVVFYRGGDRRPHLYLFIGRNRPLARALICALCALGRQRSRHELDRPRYETCEPLADLVRTLRELERPDGIARVDDEGPVAREARRPRVTRNRLAHRIRPPRDDVADLTRRAEPLQLTPHIRTERFHQPTRTSPGETSRSWVGSAGSIEASVAVTSVWPKAATRRAR